MMRKLAKVYLQICENVQKLSQNFRLRKIIGNKIGGHYANDYFS